MQWISADQLLLSVLVSQDVLGTKDLLVSNTSVYLWEKNGSPKSQPRPPVMNIHGAKHTIRYSVSRFFFPVNLYSVKLGSLKSSVTFRNTVHSGKGQEGLSFSMSFLRHLLVPVLSTKQCCWRPINTAGPTWGTLLKTPCFQSGQRLHLSKIQASLRPQEICWWSHLSAWTQCWWRGFFELQLVCCPYFVWAEDTELPLRKSWLAHPEEEAEAMRRSPSSQGSPLVLQAFFQVLHPHTVSGFLCGLQ